MRGQLQRALYGLLLAAIALSAVAARAQLPAHDSEETSVDVRHARHGAHRVPLNTGKQIADPRPAWQHSAVPDEPEDPEVATAARGLVGILREKGYSPVYGGDQTRMAVRRASRVVGIKPTGEEIFLGYDGKLTTARPAPRARTSSVASAMVPLTKQNTAIPPPALRRKGAPSGANPLALVQGSLAAPVAIPPAMELTGKSAANPPGQQKVSLETPPPVAMPQLPAPLQVRAPGPVGAGAPAGGDSGGGKGGGSADTGGSGVTSGAGSHAGGGSGVRGGGGGPGRAIASSPVSAPLESPNAFSYDNQAITPTATPKGSGRPTSGPTATPTPRGPTPTPTPTRPPIALLPEPSSADNPLVPAINRFGMKVLNKLPTSGDRVLSPTSLYLPLAMIFLGSNETAKAKLRRELGIPEEMSDEQLTAYAKALMRDHGDQKSWTSVSAGVFAGKGVKVNPEFTDLMTAFGADVAPGKASDWINGKLPGMGASLDPAKPGEVALVGVTGIRTAWAGEFRSGTMDFNGQESKAIKSKDGYRYIHFTEGGRTGEAVAITLAGGDPKKPRRMILEMASDSNPPDFDGTRLARLNATLSASRDGRSVVMPEMKPAAKGKIDEPLAAVLGSDWKKGAATGIAGDKARIDTVEQDTKLEVNKDGVKGYSVVRASVRTLSAGSNWDTVTFDRPFNYYVMEGDVCLMAGRQENPTR